MKHVNPGLDPRSKEDIIRTSEEFEQVYTLANTTVSMLIS